MLLLVGAQYAGALNPVVLLLRCNSCYCFEAVSHVVVVWEL
jgi:hypothetical protein